MRADVRVELGDVAREFLAQRERHGVHQVRPADLDDVGPRLGLVRQRVAQRPHRREQGADDLLGRGDVHGGREGVVRRLRHVHVIVGVDRGLGPELATGPLDGAVGDDLVGVHVGLGAAAGLPHPKGELAVERARRDLPGGLDDELRELRVQFAELGVGPRRGLLQDPEATDHRPRHGVGPDREMDERARRLGSPVVIGGDLDGSHGVRLDPCRAHEVTSLSPRPDGPDAPDAPTHDAIPTPRGPGSATRPR